VEKNTVSQIEPRIGVFVCHCGVNIGGVVDVPDVVKYAQGLPGVVYGEDNMYTCSEEGLSKIKKAIGEHALNRVVVASCTPRTHEPLFRSAVADSGLNPYLMEMVNIREQCSWVHSHESEKATEKAKDLVRMAVAKASLLEPQKEAEMPVADSALVVGAGIAGMTTAVSLAKQGFGVYLVEKESEIGGLARRLNSLYPTMSDPNEVLGPLTEQVKSLRNIHLLTSTKVTDVKGYVGNFDVTALRGKAEELKFNVGTIIVATGAEAYKPEERYGYGRYTGVITQLELERMLKEGELDSPKSVVMIQCVGSREEGRPYCSRICCMNAIKNALIIKERSPETQVYMLYRDIQAYGKNYEEYYTNARESGVVFILYDKDKKPEVSRSGRKLKVSVFNVFMHQQVTLDADLVVLSTPLVQHEEGRNLARILRVPLGPDGFFMEAHAKLRPIDFATDGIYVCGTAQSPKNIPESIAQAYGAASRAGILMAAGKVTAEAITAMVDEEICRGCGRCEEACEFNAITVEDTGGSKLTAKVREAVCKGCGVCSVTCPTGAITMRHFTNKQINAMLKAALAPGRG